MKSPLAILALIAIGIFPVIASEDLFYGTSSFESVSSEIPRGIPTKFEIKFQYTIGPWAISELVPIIEIVPEKAASKVQLDFEKTEVPKNTIARIPVTVTIDPSIEYEKIFLTVSFQGYGTGGTPFKSGWNDSAVLDIGPIDAIGALVESPAPEYLSPLKQVQQGIYGQDIQCRDDRVLVLKKSKEFHSCVRPQTVQKLFSRNWALNEVEVINVDTAELDSKVIKITGVIGRFTTPEGFEYHLIPLEQELPRIEYTGYDTLNLFATQDTIHHFLRNLEGKLVKVQGSFLLDGGKYFGHYSGLPTIPVTNFDGIYDKENLEYSIAGAKLLSVTKIPEVLGLNIVLLESEGGSLEITIPRDLIDTKLGGQDDSFFILVDGYEVPYAEQANNFERKLIIQFEENTKTIQIMGTQPIFPSIVQ